MAVDCYGETLYLPQTVPAQPYLEDNAFVSDQVIGTDAVHVDGSLHRIHKFVEVRVTVERM